jgi:hypothetical protein
MHSRPLVPDTHQPVGVDVNTEKEQPPGALLATRDHALIREWAARNGAEPATGEASGSGPATVHVQDGDAGIRFNFPAAARFRPISWEEWFDNFTTFDLVFVYESGQPGTNAGGRYRLVPKRDLEAACAPHPIEGL